MADTLTETAVTADRFGSPTEGEKAFLKELSGQDKGRLAMLRRNAGNTIAESRGSLWFYDLLGRYDKSGKNEEVYFLIATLFASDKDAIEGRNKFGGDFGATLRALRLASGVLASDSSPLDRRFNILLDADFNPDRGGELSFRLRQMTKLVISRKDPTVRINWSQLLRDVKFWGGDHKNVQKRWARSYYAPVLDAGQDTKSESDE